MWLAIGYAATGLGIAGAFLPLVPTTPFLLVAVYAFARSSPAMHRWLTNHPRLGPFIDNWQRYGAIGIRAKASAVALMAGALGLSWWLGLDAALLALQAAAMAGVCAFILTRPNGPGGG
jgi:uncharacterized protein